MKGQFRKGKSDNVWCLIIFGDADVLRIFANIWKSIRTKIEENTSGIEQYDEDYMRIKFESKIICLLCGYCFLKILDLNLKMIFVISAMIY